MDFQLKGKTGFISRSTSGIGFCAAKIFLQEGVIVYINGRTDTSVSKAVKHLKKQFPKGQIEGVACDFSKSEEVVVLIKKLPEINVLINNVGIYSAQSFFETTDKDWNNQLEVNVMSGVRLSRYFLPKMLEKSWGRILFVSSECATLIPADLISYSTTKTAVLAISRGLAQLTKGTGVTVNSVLPGSTMTKGAEQFLSDLAKKKNKKVSQVEAEFFSEARPNSLLQRFASEEEIANIIVYFSSPIAIATNGSAIKLEGGSMGGII